MAMPRPSRPRAGWCSAIEGLTAESPATREERRGPRADAPAQAIEGFLRATGLAREALEERAEKKGEMFFAVIERPGRKAPEIVAEVLERMVRDFPWPKSMRWGAGGLRWVRPLHAILCMLTTMPGRRWCRSRSTASPRARTGATASRRPKPSPSPPSRITRPG